MIRHARRRLCVECFEPRVFLAMDFAAYEIEAGDADGARSVHAADLDNDGDLDVLSASNYDGRIAWYKNLLPRLTGDANRDGLFTSSDMVQVFHRGEYEDDIEDNSTWMDGD